MRRKRTHVFSAIAKECKYVFDQFYLAKTNVCVFHRNEKSTQTNVCDSSDRLVCQ